MQLFLGLGIEDESSNLDWAIDVLAGRLPAHLLPVAWTNCGDAVCVSLAPRDEGAVYVWIHDAEQEEAPWRSSGYSNVHPAAPEFDQFLASFQPIPPVDTA